MKKIKDNRRGSTLVEVIVTFALIGMFLLAATTAVSAAMNAFYRMESLSRAIVVSDTILDKAQGELSLASADGALLCLGVNQVVMIGGKQYAFTQQMEILCAWKVKLLVMERDVFRYIIIL